MRRNWVGITLGRSLILGSLLLSGATSRLHGDELDRHEIQVRHVSLQDVLQEESKGIPVDRESLLSNHQNIKDLPTPEDSPAIAWQSGLIRRGSDWQRVESLGKEDLSSNLRKYREKRGDQVLDLAGHREMAHFCAGQGWKPQAIAHWYGVLGFEPNDAEARNALGFQRMGNRWVNKEEWQSLLERNTATLSALKKWLPRVKTVVAQIDRGGKDSVRAIQWLETIDVPEVVPSLHEIAKRSSGDTAIHLVSALRRFQTKDSCYALADIAISDPSSPASIAAIQGLKEIANEWYVPDLLELMASEIEVQNRIVTHPNGALILRFTCQQEWKDTKEVIQIDKLLAAGAVSTKPFSRQFRERRFAIPGAWNSITDPAPKNEVASQIALEEAVRTAKSNTAAAANRNEELRDQQKRIATVLRATSDLNLEDDPLAWWNWWQQSKEVEMGGPKGLNYQYIQEVSNPIYVPRPTFVVFRIPGPNHSCLVAGTLIQTEAGLTAIESIRIGDQVLSQNIMTGELSLKPVIRTTKRAAAPTRCMKLESAETIVSTLGHHWWVTGKGWTKTKELKEGMSIRTASGNVRIERISDSNDEVAYNLAVADNHNYFVGEQRLLSFDAGELIPTFQRVPGLPADPLKPQLASR